MGGAEPSKIISVEKFMSDYTKGYVHSSLNEYFNFTESFKKIPVQEHFPKNVIIDAPPVISQISISNNSYSNVAFE